MVLDLPEYGTQLSTLSRLLKQILLPENHRPQQQLHRAGSDFADDAGHNDGQI